MARSLDEILSEVTLSQPKPKQRKKSGGIGGLFTDSESPLVKAGEMGEKLGQGVVGVFTRPIATGYAALRGMGALGAAGLSAATGLGDPRRILAEEGRAQQVEVQRAEFVRPAQSMADALGQGLKLGSAMAAPLMSPMIAASAAPGWVTGATAAGIPALPASIGIGLEHVSPERGLVGNVGDVAMTGVAGTTAAMAIGGALGGLEDYRKYRIRKMEAKLDKSVGQVAQSMPDDFPSNKRALALIGKKELGRVKTYEDLRDVADDAVTAIKGRQDMYLADAGTEPVRLNTFDVTSGSGKNAQITNPVEDALDDLIELYRRTDDPESLSAMLDLKDIAESKGLSVADVNQLARDYGSEFGRKAFSARTGDPLTSVNAQAYENTRKAVKEAARSVLPDGYSKDLDLAMSDAIELRHQAETIGEKVQALRNKVQERGLGEKIGRVIGFVIDKITFGLGKGAVTKAFFPSNVGEKQMNWLDVERALPKNLKIIDRLLEASDDQLITELNSLMRGSGMTPLIASDLTSSVPPGGGTVGSIGGSQTIGSKLSPDDFKNVDVSDAPITKSGARADAIANDMATVPKARGAK